MTRLLLVLVLLLAPASGWAAKAADDVDHVSLAALLIRDGLWDRAAAVLDGADTSTKGFDLARYHTLVGLVRLYEQRPREAVTAFTAALDAGAEDPLVRVQLAEAWLQSADADKAVAALDAAPEAVAPLMGTWLVRGRAELKRDRPSAAWEAYSEGATRFPDEIRFDKHRVFLLVQLGLFQEAEAHARRWLDRSGGDPEAYLTLAEALRHGGQTCEAVVLLEEARLRDPGNLDVLVQLAAAWLALDEPLAAAMVLQEAAEIDVSLSHEAAEAYRRAGDLDRAMYMNGMVPDAEKKTRQRLGLLLERGDYERAVALDDRLRRLALYREDRVAYAMAYAWFQVAEPDRAEGLLEGIADPQVFQDATGLRKAMQSCAEDPVSCP